MSIYWGIIPLKSLAYTTTEDICESAVELACVKSFLESGDIAILTAGIPSPNVQKETGSVSNMMRIVMVE